ERVVARTAKQLIVARPAGQRVVAVAAEQQGGRNRAIAFVDGDRVVAGLAEHLDLGRIGDGRLTVDGDSSAVAKQGSGRVAADGDLVLGGVSKHCEHAGEWVEAGFDGHGVDPLGGRWFACGSVTTLAKDRRARVNRSDERRRKWNQLAVRRNKPSINSM